MKTFLILALLAIVATTTTALVVDPVTRSFQPSQEQSCQQPPQQHPFPPQQLDQCREYFLQRCSPTEMQTTSILGPWPTVQQNRCQVKQQQCCQQLSQIDVQSRCRAIQDVVDAIVKQQQQQQQQEQGQQGQIPSRRFGAQSQECGQQGIFSPQLLAQILPAMCNVYLPPYCTTTAAEPFGTGSN